MESSEEEYEVEEEEMLKILDSIEPPLLTCSRLFLKTEGPHSLLSDYHRQSLRTTGFVVVDNFCDFTTIREAQKEALRRVTVPELFQPAHNANTKGFDTNTRDDLTVMLKYTEGGMYLRI